MIVRAITLYGLYIICKKKILCYTIRAAALPIFRSLKNFESDALRVVIGCRRNGHVMACNSHVIACIT